MDPIWYKGIIVGGRQGEPLLKGAPHEGAMFYHSTPYVHNYRANLYIYLFSSIFRSQLIKELGNSDCINIFSLNLEYSIRADSFKVLEVQVSASADQGLRARIVRSICAALLYLRDTFWLKPANCLQLIGYFNPDYHRGEDPATAELLVQEVRQIEVGHKMTYCLPHLDAAVRTLGKDSAILMASLRDKYVRSSRSAQYFVDVLGLMTLFPTSCIDSKTGQVRKGASKKHIGVRSSAPGELLRLLIQRSQPQADFDSAIVDDPCNIHMNTIDAAGRKMSSKVISLLETLKATISLNYSMGPQARYALDDGVAHQFGNLFGGLYLVRSANGSGVFIHVYVRSTSKKAVLKPIRKMFPSPTQTDERHLTTRIDALIHKYLSMASSLVADEDADLFPKSASARKTRVNRLLAMLPVGTNQVMACVSFLSYLGTGHAAVFWEYVRANHSLRLENEMQRVWVKQAGNLARRCEVLPNLQPLTSKQVAAVAYLDMAFGRSGNTSDWDEEYKLRCQTVHHIRAPTMPYIGADLRTRVDPVRMGDNPSPDPVFYQLLAKQLRKIMPYLINPRAVQEPWSNFVERRHEWIAAGSAGGTHFDASPAVAPNRDGTSSHTGTKRTKIHVSKRVWGETITAQELVSYLDNAAPLEAATASEKFENGKSRAIYGVDPWHYSINTYATSGMEERLHQVPGLEKGATGLKESAFAYKRMVATSDPFVECTMLDYADFNIQHTIESQAILFREMRRAGERLGACNDWIKAVTWLERAKYNMTVKFPGKQFPTRVTQGMFSGTRSTDLINTLLNLSYFMVGKDFLAGQGFHAAKLYHIHQGDDVWLSNNNPLWSQMLYQVLVKQGFVFRDSKQMFGSGRGEFLRVLYSKGSGLGYLNRALTNFVLRPLQAKLNLDPIAWAHTIDEGCKVMVRRGLSISMARVVWFDATEFWVKVVSHGEDHAPVKLPKNLLYTAPELGGLGVLPPAMICTSLQPVSIPKMTSKLTGVDWDKLPNHMSKDWISHVSKYSLPQHRTIRAKILVESMVQENYRPDLSNLARDKGPNEFKRAVSHVLKQQPVTRKTATLITQVSGPEESIQRLGAIFPETCYVSSSIVTDTLVREMDAACRTPEDTREPDNLSAHLRRYIARNQFKSETRLAAAYGISRTEALSMIVGEAAMNPSSSDDTIQILSQIITSKRLDLLDVLLSGGSSMYSTLQYWYDSQMCNTVCAAMHQKLIRGAIVQEGCNKGVLWFTGHGPYVRDTVASLLQTIFPVEKLQY